MGYPQQYQRQLQYRLSIASTHSAALRSVLSIPIGNALGGSFLMGHLWRDVVFIIKKIRRQRLL